MIGVGNLVEKYAGNMRFPVLAALMALAFLADLFIPDVLPFVDEIILAIATVMISRIRKPSANKDPLLNEENIANTPEK